MAKVQNTFLKSKMNKDLDARLLPEGEYRDAQNAQVSKSESANVGNLENVLGNKSIENFNTLTGVANLKCIGTFSDEINSTVYLFFTTNTQTDYKPSESNFIIAYNTLAPSQNASRILVQGAFLNFSTQNPIHGINVLENLLFFTDNRNQPRVIDIDLARDSFYLTEDQISVAKYSPYEAIEMFQKNTTADEAGAPIPFETTMKDVSSVFLPNGGSALITTASGTGNVIDISGIKGEINDSSSPYGTTITVGLMNMTTREVTIQSGISVTTLNSSTQVTLSGNITFSQNQLIVFNKNPYYDAAFGGDPDYLEDKFVRFSYRFKYVDNTYSIFAPFTQPAFIPKQDGYFMYSDGFKNPVKNDQAETYRSTVVSFVENKVNKIDLKIPLPFPNYSMQDALKLSEIDILYKESDAVAVKLLETIKIDKINNQSAIALVNGNQTPGAAGNDINIDNIRGGILIGSIIEGIGIPSNTKVTSFVPTDPSNPFSGKIQVDKTVANLDDNTLLTINEITYFKYEYNSSKPTRTLPEAELVRVFDKTPVKALAQEISGNRVIYGNFENKHTPPDFINYNVAATSKTGFNLNEITAAYNAGAATYAGGANINIIINKVPTSGAGGLYPGMIITCIDYGVIIPENTIVVSATSNTAGASTIQLNNAVTFPAGTISLIFAPGGSVEDSTSIVEYPSSSVKTNRNYQVGFVLSDRYGRQSSVILSNNEEIIKINNIEYSGSTLYSPYINEGFDTDAWPGNSLKVLVNEPINGVSTGLYNGDVTSDDYNPLGWYSYKIVVKQTQQEYYNVYLPGIMASYPNDQVKELNQTSHVVLINDNINKVPRDLNEVGPEQRQFRSSVRLFGRVQNSAVSVTSLNQGAANIQYYPGITSDTVSTISTVNDLFEYDPINPPQPNYFPQFYSLNSNPLIARITTSSLIGNVSTTSYLPGSGVVDVDVPPSSMVATFTLNTVSGAGTTGINDLEGYLITGPGIPDETYIVTNSYSLGSGVLTVSIEDKDGVPVKVSVEKRAVMRWVPTNKSGGLPPFELITPGIQYLAVYETEPVESLLDLYWETSSSGLISDLNSAILNNQSNPAGANLGPISTQNFTEGLAEQGQVFSQNFGVLNDFGSSITLDPSAGDTLVLQSVVNGFGDSCFGEDSPRDFFRLEDTSGASGVGPWNVRTTSPNSSAGTNTTTAAKSYWENMFYMNDEENSPVGFNRLRQFTFNFVATVHGTDSDGNVVAQESNISINANLGNVPPTFYRVQINPTTGTEYGTINGQAIPNPVEFNATPETDKLVLLQAWNGNANIEATYNGTYLGLQDLEYSPGDFNVQITSQTQGSIGGTPALFNGEPIFALQTPSGFDAAELRYNNFALVNTATGVIPADVYFVTVQLRDGGATTTVNFRIDMRVVITSDMIYNRAGLWRARRFYPDGQQNTVNFGNFAYLYEINGGENQVQNYSINGFPHNLSFDAWHRDQIKPMTVIYIAPGTPGVGAGADGYYIYAGGFFDTDFTGDCRNRYGSSKSLVSYSGQGNSIVIPRFNANSQGHKCQGYQGFSGGVGSSGDRPPHVKGQATITALPNTNGLSSKQVQVDPTTLVGFDDFGNTNNVPTIGMRCYARDWIKWELNINSGFPFDNASGGISANRSRGEYYPQRVQSYNSTTGVITFQNLIKRSGDGAGPAGQQRYNGQVYAGWQVGDPLNFFNGKLTSNSNPWFHATATANGERAIFDMLMFSEWGPGLWYRYALWDRQSYFASTPPFPSTTPELLRTNLSVPACDVTNQGIPEASWAAGSNLAGDECTEWLGTPGQPDFVQGDFTFTII